MVLTLGLSSKCEVNEEGGNEAEEAGVLLDEMDGRVSEETQVPSPTMTDTSEIPVKKSRFQQISQATRNVMYKLWFLLVVDSLADGMVGYSLTTYYMDQKFDLPKSTLGDIT